MAPPREPLTGHRVHFVGIGGVGMASLAEILLGMGYTVTGSDLKTSRTVNRLLDLGVDVSVPHRAEAVDGADHVVVNAAIPADNPERLRAAELDIEELSRASLLGRVAASGTGVAVAGTHGKTTTASMTAAALEAAGLDPTFIIGGDINDVGSGGRLGAGDHVVVEADEFNGSFLELTPDVAVITNVDRDHLDFYADQDAIDAAFVAFTQRLRPGGALIACRPDPGVSRVLPDVRASTLTYGWDDADLMVDPSDGRVVWQGADVGVLAPAVPGRHNVLNAAGALAAALVCGAEAEAALAALNTFGGVDRRFSLRGQANGVRVVDDYAHNPRKVAATLQAAREAYPGSRVVALFQPHLYSRTARQADEFGTVFTDADLVIVTDIYAAREEPVPGVSGRLIADAARRGGTTVIYVPRLEEAAGFVAGLAEPGDVILTMGAGDITSAAPRILDLMGHVGEEA